MDMMRRALSGRLCEIVGERSLGKNPLPPLSGGTTLDADPIGASRTVEIAFGAGVKDQRERAVRARAGAGTPAGDYTQPVAQAQLWHSSADLQPQHASRRSLRAFRAR